jgi:hypothetical protein
MSRENMPVRLGCDAFKSRKSLAVKLTVVALYGGQRASGSGKFTLHRK